MTTINVTLPLKNYEVLLRTTKFFGIGNLIKNKTQVLRYFSPLKEIYGQ